jgi:hypothetical protein
MKPFYYLKNLKNKSHEGMFLWRGSASVAFCFSRRGVFRAERGEGA